MKKCSNIECGTENPDDAKFCRVCGESFPITQPIKWKDTSLVEARKVGKGKELLGTILITIFVCFFGLFGVIGIIEANYFGGIFFIIFAIWILGTWIFNPVDRTKKLRSIASSIEDTQNDDRLISKAGKLGLYDWKEKKVLLPVIYDSLETLNSGSYYIPSQGRKKGIYSRSLNKLIVPCEYDSVTSFINNVATITKDNITKQVDTQGNIF